VRPEKIRLEAPGTPEGDGENALETRVQVATYLGVSHQYTLEGPQGTVLTAFVPNVDAAAPGPGAAVRAVWRPEHSFVVQEEDQQR
jgi:spermidine/putrescine transport system ATP-binding protein